MKPRNIAVRFFLLGLVALLFPFTASASGSPLIEQLKRELEGKSFTAIKIGGIACVEDQGTERPTYRLVDTEVYDNDIRYRPHATIITYCKGGDLDHRNSPMKVKQITGKSDRIEIQLEEVGRGGDEAYGKVKLMLGRGYEFRPLEEIETKLARVLEIPRIKELAQARKKCESAHEEIVSLQAILSGNVDTQRKLDVATKLIDLYKEVPSDASRLNAVAFTSVPVPDTSSVIATTQKTLAGIQLQLKQEKTAAALKQYDAAMNHVRARCDTLPSGDVRSRDELSVQVAAVGIAQQELSVLESARGVLLNLGQSVPASDGDYVTKCRESFVALSYALSQQERKVQAYEASIAEKHDRAIAKERAQNSAIEEAEKFLNANFTTSNNSMGLLARFMHEGPGCGLPGTRLR